MRPPPRPPVPHPHTHEPLAHAHGRATRTAGTDLRSLCALWLCLVLVRPRALPLRRQMLARWAGGQPPATVAAARRRRSTRPSLWRLRAFRSSLRFVTRAFVVAGSPGGGVRLCQARRAAGRRGPAAAGEVRIAVRQSTCVRRSHTPASMKQRRRTRVWGCVASRQCRRMTCGEGHLVRTLARRRRRGLAWRAEGHVEDEDP